MSNQLKRAILRNKGVDIEIQTIGFSDGTNWRKTGKYRYVISIWQSNDLLKKNIYDEKQYDSYEDAENAAIHTANLELTELSCG